VNEEALASVDRSATGNKKVKCVSFSLAAVGTFVIYSLRTCL